MNKITALSASKLLCKNERSNRRKETIHSHKHVDMMDTLPYNIRKNIMFTIKTIKKHTTICRNNCYYSLFKDISVAHLNDFDINTHTGEKKSNWNLWKHIFKISLLTHYQFSLVKIRSNESDILRRLRELYNGKCWNQFHSVNVIMRVYWNAKSL